MFNLREFIKKGLHNGIGKLSDCQIILNAAGWADKGVLTEEDLTEIDNKIDAQYTEDAGEICYE